MSSKYDPDVRVAITIDDPLNVLNHAVVYRGYSQFAEGYR
jgi:hypothetical protein